MCVYARSTYAATNDCKFTPLHNFLLTYFQLKQRCFSAWYRVIADRRLKAGKAKAMSDWKVLLRAFNAWKAHAREKRLTREAWAHEENIKLSRRCIIMLIYIHA